MAIQPRKINPLDRQPRKIVGVDLPFESKAVFTPTYQTKDAIKANLINLFLTGRGERYLNPNFGLEPPLRQLIFEPLTSAVIESVRETIEEGVARYFPRVTVTKLDVLEDINNNRIQIYLIYQINDTGIEDELALTFEP